jgi:NDP-sugar pyrophosphorylase family protein
MILDGEFIDLVYHGSEIRPGILAGEWPSVHADARCFGKAFIGAHVRIGRDVKLEGYVSIGSNCVVASGAEIRNSIVLPGTYIGSMARLDGDIAFAGKLIHGDGACIQIDDPRLVASTDIEPAHILSHFRRLLKQSLQHSS